MIMQECTVEEEGGETIRGKLRDKRSDTNQKPNKRDEVEHRRPQKRKSRISNLHIHHLEDDYLFAEEDVQPVTSIIE